MKIVKAAMVLVVSWLLVSVSFAQDKGEVKVVPSGPFTLDECVKTALENNPILKAEEWESTAARARMNQARGKRWPSLSAVGGYKHYVDDQALIPSRFNGDKRAFGDDFFSADLVLSLPLFTGGRLVNEIKAAELLRKSAEHQLARTRERLVFNVSSLFFSILSQRYVIDSLRFSERALHEHLKKVDQLISVHKAAQVDRLRTEVRIADLEQKLSRENNVLEIQRRALANTMGIKETQNPLRIQGKLVHEEEAVPQLYPVILQALSERADYLGLREVVEAQAKKVSAARAGYWPTVTLQGSYGRRWVTNPTETPPGADESEDVGQVATLLNIPLFQGGQVRARVHEERAKLDAARERLRNLELRIRLEVRTALLNIGSAQERINATEKAVEQARESLRIEQEKYQLGKGSIIDVLDAQSALLNAQTNYYRSLADYRTARAQLRLAVGEGK